MKKIFHFLKQILYYLKRGLLCFLKKALHVIIKTPYYIKTSFRCVKEGFLFFAAAAVIVTVAFGSLLNAGKETSPRYGDDLPPAPTFTFESYLNGRFQQSGEQYLAGQIWPRDLLTMTHSLADFLLFKNESHGIAYGRGGYTFRIFYDFDVDTLMANLNAIDSFAYHTVSNVSVMIVPTANYVLKDYLPAGLPDVDQNYYISEFYRYWGDSVATTINVADALAVEAIRADSYLYYRTDPHWTSYGAWLAYSQLMAVRGQSLFPYDARAALRSTGFLGANYAASKALFPRADEIAYFDFAADITFPAERGKPVTMNSLYDDEQFAERNQYAAFLYGDHARAEITSQQSSNKLDTIVVICDSFGYSFIPFLTQNYNHIIMIDPRYYDGSFEELRGTHYDDVLILMSFESICTDASFAKLNG